MKQLRVFILFLIALMMLSACSGTSFKSESKTTEKNAKAALNEKAKKPNKTLKSVDFYLPFGYEIEKESPNNLILKNGSKTYILFYNPQEKSASKIVYNATVEQHKTLDVNVKFEKEGKFSYLLIEKLKDDQNEVTVGIGGTKITTETATSSMKNEAKTMMQIVNSVKIK